MNDIPKISIITISYNQDKFVEETIQSVLSQDYPNIEYIIIDGGSTDNTLSIINKYSGNVYYLETGPDDGPASALNKGFTKANGDYYYYLNSDDVLLPGAISKVVNFMNHCPGYDVYYGHAYVIDGRSKITRGIFSDWWDIRLYANNLISIVQPSTFIKREIYLKTNGFNKKNKTCWDGELLVDLSLNGGRFKRLPFKVAKFRVHEQSITGSQQLNEKFAIDSTLITEKIHSLCKVPLIYRVKGINHLMKFLRDPYLILRRIIQKLRK